MGGTYVEIRNAISLSALVHMLDNLKYFFFNQAFTLFCHSCQFLTGLRIFIS